MAEPVAQLERGEDRIAAGRGQDRDESILKVPLGQVLVISLSW
jgi:hypothetical protein